MSSEQSWYIVKTEAGHCQVIAQATEQSPETEVHWGPFQSKEEAIAHRIGLIRAKKCQPQ